MKEIRISFIIILMLIFISKSIFGSCYLLFDDTENNEDRAFTRYVFTKYLEPVKEVPVDGIRPNSCVYEISTIHTEDSVQLIINGPRLMNAEAGNYKTALLRAVFKSSKIDLCTQYSDILLDLCEIGISVLFMNEEGEFTYKPSGQFKIFIIAKRRLYVYLINKDKSKVRILFPSKDQKNPLLRGKVYLIPSLESGETFYSDDLKSEEIYAMFSTQPIEDTDLLFNLRKKKGIFIKRLF